MKTKIMFKCILLVVIFSFLILLIEMGLVNGYCKIYTKESWHTIYCDDPRDTKLGCEDSGVGDNHGCDEIPNGCYPWEGEDNYGEEGCRITCARECEAGDIETKVCHTCGWFERVCQSSCYWGEWNIECAGQPDDCSDLCNYKGFYWYDYGTGNNCCGDDANEYYDDVRSCDRTHACCDSAFDYVLGYQCVSSCDPDGDGYFPPADCDDTNLNIYPGAPEICNSLDDNCDGLVDEDFDVDKDGFTTCSVPADCDDNNKNINPTIKEICNGVDDNCDNTVDEGCLCISGKQRECGSDIGICKKGMQLCKEGLWGFCIGSITPKEEICDNGLDDDCDSSIDEDCKEQKEREQQIEKLKEFEPEIPTVKESCFDGVQNQGEEGIDCGGPCSTQCTFLQTFKTKLGIKKPAAPAVEVETLENCGDKKIDPGENCRNCKDAVCLVGEKCSLKGECVEAKERSFEYYLGLAALIIVVLILFTYFYQHSSESARENMKKVLIIVLIIFLFSTPLLAYYYREIKTVGKLPSKVNPADVIIIEQSVADNLNSYYNENKPNEFVACLRAKYSKGRYQIYDTNLLETNVKSFVAVQHKPCSKVNLLGTIHSHPDGLCALSKQDVLSFGQRNEHLAAIICKENTFGFFPAEFLENSMFYMIRDTEK